VLFIFTGFKAIMLKAKLKSLFKFSRNKKIVDVINESRLFDETYYLAVYGKYCPYKTALEHYIAEGASKFYDPSPFFSTAYYLQANEDIRKTKINPHFHYIEYGEKEGRCPNAYFIPAVYLRLNTDLANWDKSLLSHYILLGRDEGRHYYERIISPVTTVRKRYQQWIIKMNPYLFGK
jgi:hypothetical protein